MNGRDYKFIAIDEAAGEDWTAIQLVQSKLVKRKGVVTTTWHGPTAIIKRRPWWKMFSVVRLGRTLIVFFRNSTWRIGWWAVALAMLAGCSLPCTYHGKAVPRADADRMKSMGMDVVCP